MAAFLNKPSDFTTKSATTQEPLTLLPPSAFEKPKGVTSGQSDVKLKKAAEEIQTLRLENQKLKNRLDGSMSELTTFHTSGATHRSLPADERRYADELISRQAEELSKLRAQVQQLENSQQSMRENYEHRLQAMERERDETVAALSDSLMRKEEQCNEEVSELKQQYEGEVLDLKSRLEHMSADLEQSKGDLTAQVTDLMTELRSVRQQAKQGEEKLQQELREKEGEVCSQAQQLQQLKTYITESEQQHHPQQVWIQQCETLTNKLKIADAEKETLESTIQLLNVRLNSVKEILLTQETELSKGKEEMKDKNKLKDLLLTRWRQKVYSLLVQQKSAEMVSHKDVQNWKEKIALVEENLSSAHNRINILQHTVAEREADLQLADNRNKGLQQQMDHAGQVAVCLEEQVNKDGASVLHLADFTHMFEEKVQQQMSVWQQASGQLKSLGQRVSFASSRMDLLKSGMEKAHMTEELSRVSRERDMLVGQLQEDSEKWTEKISSLRSQYDAEVTSLKRTVEDLESSSQDKSQLLERLGQELQAVQSDLGETKECRDQLGTELARHQHTMEQALQEQRQKLEEEFTEHLADMERKMNDARREHTKAVVALRQQERQWGRERERGEEVRSTTEAHYQAQIHRLYHDLQTLEKERNLFMATLRQEGLLGKLRSERREPMTLALQEGEDGEEEEEITLQPQDSDSATQVTETDSLQALQESSEPVSAVLEDLKSLVPAVLGDSGDTSDDNQD